MSSVSIAHQTQSTLGEGDITILLGATFVCWSHRQSNRRGKLSVDLALSFADVEDSLPSEIVEGRFKNLDVVAQSGDA